MSCMKIIVFDTETTGLPLSQGKLSDQPHICQFASLLLECDLPNRRLLKINQIDQLINPGVPIPSAASDIHHITDEQVAQSPSFAEFADTLLHEFHEADIAVAHNLPFDKQLIEIELSRLNLNKNFLPTQTFDTMASTRDLCRLPGRHGNYKAPRLEELYRFLFQKNFTGAHNALQDVIATVHCMLALIKQGVFQPKEPPSKQRSLF